MALHAPYCSVDKMQIPSKVLQSFREGAVIPILPVALADPRALDEERQRALVRYYIDAGAGGIAVEARSDDGRRLSESLFSSLRAVASETADRWCERKGRQVFKLVEAAGTTKEAIGVAEAAFREGYHACLIDLSPSRAGSARELLEHLRAIAEVVPVVGYLRRGASGAGTLGPEFFPALLTVENLIGLALGTCDRYQTLKVVRAVCEAGRERDVTLYTGNHDTLLIDLLTSYTIPTDSGIKQVRIVGGMLSLWGVWTSRAVELLKRVHAIIREGRPLPVEFLSVAVELSDASSAILDVEHSFAGQAAGIREILRRQGLLRSGTAPATSDGLSAEQAAEIDRVLKSYPHLADDDFVSESLSRWIAG